MEILKNEIDIGKISKKKSIKLQSIKSKVFGDTPEKS